MAQTTAVQPPKSLVHNFKNNELKELKKEINAYIKLVDKSLTPLLDSTSTSWPPQEGKPLTLDVLWYINLSNTFKQKPEDGISRLIANVQDWRNGLERLFLLEEYSKGKPAAVLRKLQKSLVRLHALAVEIDAGNQDGNNDGCSNGQTNSYKVSSTIN